MFTNHKIGVIPFKEFMSRPATLTQKKTPLQSNIYSLFQPISITSFFPLGDQAFAIFLFGGAVIAGIALTEIALATNGMTAVSSAITSLVKFVLPILGYGLIFWFLFQI